MRFRTTILQSGKTATGIRVPPEVVEALGSGKRPAVKVTINGYTYRSTVARAPGHRRQDRRDPAAPHRQVGRRPEAGTRPLRVTRCSAGRRRRR
jgi:hypothetical protein